MTTQNNVLPLSNVTEINDRLTETIRQEAKTLLAEAVRLEIDEFLHLHAGIKDDVGRRQVVRNGYLPERTLQTGVGNVPIKVLSEVFPGTQHQRCWVHKTRNVLNKLPKSEQVQGKERIRAIYMVSTRDEAEDAMDHFVNLYSAKYLKAAT